MKVHEAGSVNGTLPPEDDDEEQAEEEYDYSALFNAPNYADFIKTAPNSKARGYEVRVQSLMKAGLVMSLNAENWSDAATFMKHGPGFAKATGNFAAENAKVAAIVDMLTAPDSPALMFAMVALPMISQLVRNHEPEVAQAATSWREARAIKKQERKAGYRKPATPPITVRIFKREFKLPIRFRLRFPKLKNVFSSFLAPTQHPDAITAEVFNDPAVVKAIHKLGIFPRNHETPSA